MWTRRSFLRLAGSAPVAVALGTCAYGIPEIQAATTAVAQRTPEEVAADESYWREIQFAFSLDRTLINLNNGNSCPAPTVVHEAPTRWHTSRYRGLRITPNIYTPLEEIDTFVEAMRKVAKEGLPA